MDRNEAYTLLTALVPEEKYRRHSLTVEAALAELAKRLGEDKEIWGRTGLLHDIDLLKVQERMELHGILAAEWLTEKNEDPRLVYAIEVHNNADPATRKDKLDWALISMDMGYWLVDSFIQDENSDKSYPTMAALLERLNSPDRERQRGQILEGMKLGLLVNTLLEIVLEKRQQIDRNAE